jgi:2-polyprenyl-3-methyl-5-hydroxy-6-metoxy-1,4-benzoquinol methylase
MAEPADRNQFFDDAAEFFNWRSQTGQFRERERKFLAVARSALEKSPTKSPLCVDLGCGPGAITLQLASLGFETIGVDSSAAMIDLASKAAGAASQVHGRLTFTQADLGTFLDTFESQADLIVSSSVFEYLEDPSRIIELVAAHVRPGGLFAVSVPNERSVYRWVEPLLMLRKPKAVRYTRHWHNKARAKHLIAEAAALGLQPVEVSYFGHVSLSGRPILARFSHAARVGTMTLIVFVKT